MPIATLISTPCTITRGTPGDADDFGLDTPSGDDPVTVDTVCDLQQRNRSEAGDGGEVSLTDWVCFFLPDETLSTADVVTVDDRSYEVIGDPWKVRESHVEATVRRTAGSQDAS